MAIASHCGEARGAKESLTVIGLIANRGDQARLAGALRGFARFRAVASLDECRALLHEELATVAALILEAQDLAGVPTMPFVAQLNDSLPAVPILGYCDVGPRRSGDAVALIRAGVHDIVLRGVDDGALALRDAVVGASHSTAAHRVIVALRPLVDPSILPLLEHCLTFGRHAITVTDAALALGVHRKTLVNLCARAKLPPPAMLVGWCRLFLVAALLERKSYTVERIAHELDYASSTALRNAIRRYVGVTATEVRERGGLRFVLDHFARRMEQWRVGAHDRGHRPRRASAETDVAVEVTAGGQATPA
ncbi:MAG TPA: helix-turn-helix domain-containing protein [Gemmatimonadaceae bacterium]|nr:helix-turn-helix domain-containing protein [Gemmatimonadaceae bacterium]